MTHLRSHIRLSVAALVAALLVLALGVAPASASPRIDRVEARGSAEEVLDYWTNARMRAAKPVVPEVPDGPVPDPAPEEGGSPTVVPPAQPRSAVSAPLLRGSVESASRRGGEASLISDPSAPKIRAHGKVFFTVVGGSAPGDRVCSGTAINSRNRSVVLTAGHCVYDAESGGGASRNLIFVPAYGGGEKPFGEWAAKSLAYPRKWKKFNFAYDIGIAVMSRNSDGQRLGSVVGGRGIGFDQPRDQKYRAFGYPVEGRFDGSQDEYQCRSDYKGSDVPGSGPSTIRIACDMGRGASGGGWIAGARAVVSVTSYYYESQPGSLYGPYLSSTAKALYKKVRG